MTEHPAPLAIVRTTDDLREVFRRRVAEMNISLETLDAIAGLPTRYSSKVLGLQPTRRFCQFSLDGLLGALGLMLIVVEDTEALARVQRRLEAAPLVVQVLPAGNHGARRRAWLDSRTARAEHAPEVGETAKTATRSWRSLVLAASGGPPPARLPLRATP